MLIVHVKKRDIERALKELKGKIIKTRQNSKINERKEYEKESIKRRREIQKAEYRENFKPKS
jgi:small subunit ribosomal protein S21